MTVNDSGSAAGQKMPEAITLAGQARLWLWHHALPAAQHLLLQADLNAALDWQQPRIQVFGRYHTVPRLTAWHGDAGIPYRYSGHQHVADGWPDVLKPVRDTVSELCGHPFNSVLANRYRNGKDCMGDNSLLLMSPQVQQQFQHALPRRQRVQGERLNLTFRRIFSGISPRTRN